MAVERLKKKYLMDPDFMKSFQYWWMMKTKLLEILYIYVIELTLKKLCELIFKEKEELDTINKKKIIVREEGKNC